MITPPALSDAAAGRYWLAGLTHAGTPHACHWARAVPAGKATATAAKSDRAKAFRFFTAILTAGEASPGPREDAGRVRRTNRDLRSPASAGKSAHCSGGMDPSRAGTKRHDNRQRGGPVPALFSPAARGLLSRRSAGYTAALTALRAVQPVQPPPTRFLAGAAAVPAADRLAAWIEALAARPENRGALCHWERLPARPPRHGELSLPLPAPLAEALAARGIERLYTHQVQAIEALRGGLDTVV